ncbi:MAG: hypothetical protein MAG451_00637 [Anaerolineales bacterium]|nr:hypothetical protein [Anaerolineales bacterium]
MTLDDVARSAPHVLRFTFHAVHLVMLGEGYMLGEGLVLGEGLPTEPVYASVRRPSAIVITSCEKCSSCFTFHAVHLHEIVL